MNCNACGEYTEVRYFLRRNWKTKKWTVVKKWHDVGGGLCKLCAVVDANNGNRLHEQSKEGT